jgi:primosomal replication protein N
MEISIGNVNNTNNVILIGRVAKVYPLKHTLSGLPVVSFVVEHESRQLEAGMPLNVRCRVYCIALDQDYLIGDFLLNTTVEVQGFLSYNSRSQLILHVRQTKFLDKGN